MFHVIEHLPDPSKVISIIRKKLKNNGILIIETPNINNIWFKILRKKWRQFIFDHYYFYSNVTIKKLLGNFGFNILYIKSIGKTVSLRFLCNRFERLNKNTGILISKIVNLFNLNDRQIYLNPKDVMIVVSKKNKN